jgi:Fur family transcriptional regulator, ferric uptake regulator
MLIQNHLQKDRALAILLPMTRQTSQRTAIEKVFQQETRPMGVDEILAKGRKIVKSLNQATVYRNLRLLVEQGWLKQIHHPDMGTLYERTGKAHHHHFHCRVCNRVFELPGCALDTRKAIPSGFIVEDHEVFLSGVCQKCAG